MNSQRKRFHPLQIVTLLVSALLTCPTHAQAQTLPDKPVVKGTFLGDGKEGNLQHLVVQTREPFSDQAAIRLVFTEKSPAKSEKPDFDAAFKKLGSALILSVFRDGGIFGCEVAHTAHSKSPFSAIGTIKMQEFNVTETHVSGRVTTGGEQDAFGQKWDVDLTFSAPLPKGAFAAASEPASAAKPEMAKKADKEEAEPGDAGPKLPVAELPLPSGAREVEYKQVVGHILFRADPSVSVVAADFARKLKQQGWQDAPGSLIGKTNAILKRKRHGADLTIMIQPESSGCTVKVFTQGLDWSQPPASTAGSTAPPPAKSGGAGDAEAEANRLLQDALKQIPGGFLK